MARSGITLIESIVILAVLSIVLVLGFVAFGTGGSVGRAARDVATAVRFARWTAVGEGRAVVLLQAGDGSLARAAGDGFSCSAEDAVRVVWERPRSVVVDWPRMGLAFAADGRPRRCDGSGVGNATIDVRARDGSRAAVIVAVTGRVRWEHR